MNDERDGEFDITCFNCLKTYKWNDGALSNRLAAVLPCGDNVVMTVKVSVVKKNKKVERNQKCCDTCLETFLIQGVSV